MSDARRIKSVPPAEWAFLAVLLFLFFLLAFVTYYTLGEDAFISFRYAENLARGRGLVYNAGEWVEGYSNLLWVLLLAPFDWLGIRLHVAARVLSTILFAALVVAGWWLGRTLTADRWPRWAGAWIPVALALEPYLHFHDDRGLETTAYAALLGMSLFAVALRRFMIAAALAGLATIIRPEGIGFALVLLPAVYTAGEAPEAWRRCLRFALVPLGLFIAQVLFRRIAYHEWVPNTVIAKHPSGSGFREVLALICSHAFVPIIGAVGCALALRDRGLRPLATGSLCTMAAAILFQVKAGALLNEGFRYLIPLMVPSVVGTWLLILAAPARARLYAAGPLLLLFPVTIFTSNEADLFRGNGDARRSQVVVRIFEKPTWNLRERWRWYLSDPVFINAEVGRWTADALPPGTVIAADQMGQLGYYAGPDRTIIDLLGLMDRRIARNGVSVAYLEERAVGYVIVQVADDSDFWPRDLRLKPSVPHLRELFEGAEFRENYRPRYFLRSRVPIMRVGFMVYIQRGIDDGMPMEEVPLGVDGGEFERGWRVMDAQP